MLDNFLLQRAAEQPSGKTLKGNMISYALDVTCAILDYVTFLIFIGSTTIDMYAVDPT